MKISKLASIAVALLLSITILGCTSENSSMSMVSISDGTASGVEITAENSDASETNEEAIVVGEDGMVSFDSMGDKNAKGSIHVTLTSKDTKKVAVDDDFPLGGYVTRVAEPGTYDVAIECKDATGTLRIYSGAVDDAATQVEQLVNEQTSDVEKTVEEAAENGEATSNN